VERGRKVREASTGEAYKQQKKQSVQRKIIKISPKFRIFSIFEENVSNRRLFTHEIYMIYLISIILKV
jgi:hypothetical protein